MGEIDARVALEHFGWYDLLAAFKVLAAEELIEPFNMEALRAKMRDLKSPSDQLLKDLHSAIEDVLGVIHSAILAHNQNAILLRRYKEYEILYDMLEVV